jgi:hypothetical protein
MILINMLAAVVWPSLFPSTFSSTSKQDDKQINEIVRGERMRWTKNWPPGDSGVDLYTLTLCQYFYNIESV